MGVIEFLEVSIYRFTRQNIRKWDRIYGFHRCCYGWRDEDGDEERMRIEGLRGSASFASRW